MSTMTATEDLYWETVKQKGMGKAKVRDLESRGSFGYIMRLQVKK